MTVKQVAIAVWILSAAIVLLDVFKGWLACWPLLGPCLR